jgi:hypothetical protein
VLSWTQVVTTGGHTPRRPGACRLGRRAAAVAALAAVTAGCGSSSPHVAGVASAATTTQGTTLAFARCMRSNGVAQFPDPTPPGTAEVKPTPSELGVTSSTLQTAEGACRHFLPAGGRPTQTALQQSWNEFRSFARCMRGHGVPSWPDPTRYPQHPDRPTFDLQQAGLDPNSPHVSTKVHDCLPLLRGNNPQHLGQGGS